ncbi:MAG: PA2169 family four-helix-bundle protein [Terracidiphilus sp.]|jgi:uncharacterized protein (TIGR02284 family)
MPQPRAEALQSETAVQSVIEILVDSQEGLVTVGERLQDQTLKRYFFAESLLRAEFISQLETALCQRGVSRFRERGSTAAALHRTWARIKSRFVGGDHTLLVTAEQGEDAVNEIYSRAMETRLPTAIHEILTAQVAHIQLTHDFVKTARDRPAAVDETAQSTVPASQEVSH